MELNIITPFLLLYLSQVLQTLGKSLTGKHRGMARVQQIVEHFGPPTLCGSVPCPDNSTFKEPEGSALAPRRSCQGMPYVHGTSLCLEDIELNPTTCAFSQTYMLGARPLSLKIYCKYVDRSHRCCRNNEHTDNPLAIHRGAFGPFLDFTPHCPLGICPSVEFSLSFPDCLIDAGIAWNENPLTLAIFCAQFNKQHRCCTRGEVVTSAPTHGRLEYICLFGKCKDCHIILDWPECLLVNPPVIGSTTLSLATYCIATEKRHKCCKPQHYSGPPTPAPPAAPIASPVEGICPLGICAICPRGICTFIELNYPLCVFNTLITWDGEQLNLIIYCEVFDQDHPCCTAGSNIVTIENTAATCLFGYCILGSVKIGVNCNILKPPLFGEIVLTLPLICQFLEPGHPCCLGVTFPPIDRKCPFGICIVGTWELNFPSCSVTGVATWNTMPITLPLICLLFQPKHRCCSEAPICPGPGPVKPEGNITLEINGGKPICLFGFCWPDDGTIIISEFCVIINPPLVGLEHLTIDMICRYVNPYFRCCNQITTTTAAPTTTTEPPTIPPECHEVPARQEFCITIFICFQIGNLRIDTACKLIHPPFIPTIGTLTLGLFCKKMNPLHRCCGNQACFPATTTPPPEPGSGSSEETGGGSPEDCDRVRPANNKICIHGVCIPFPVGGLEISVTCVIVNAPIIGVFKLTIPLFCQFVNKHHRCCGRNQNCGGVQIPRPEICDWVGDNGKICYKGICVRIPSGGLVITKTCKIKTIIYFGLTKLTKTILCKINKLHWCCGNKECEVDNSLGEIIKITRLCWFGKCFTLELGSLLLGWDCVLKKAPKLDSVTITLPFFCWYIMPAHKCCKDFWASIDWLVNLQLPNKFCMFGLCVGIGNTQITEECHIKKAPLFDKILLNLPLLCLFGNRKHKCCQGALGAIEGGIHIGGKICIFGICKGLIIDLEVDKNCILVNPPYFGETKLTLPLFCIWVNPLHKCCKNGGGGNTGVGTVPPGVVCLFGWCVPSVEIQISLDCKLLKPPVFGGIKLTMWLFCWKINPAHKCCSNVIYPPGNINVPCPFGICPIPPNGGIDITIDLIFGIFKWPFCRITQPWLWNGKLLTLEIFCQVFLPNHKCCREPPTIGPPGGQICLLGHCIPKPPPIIIDADCKLVNVIQFGQVILDLKLFCWLINPGHECCKDVGKPEIGIPCPLGICPPGPPIVVPPLCIVIGSWNGMPLTLPLFCLLFDPDHECCKGVPPVVPPPGPSPSTPVTPSPPPGNCIKTFVCILGHCEFVCIRIVGCKVTPIVKVGPYELDLEAYCRYVNRWHSCCKQVTTPAPPPSPSTPSPTPPPTPSPTTTTTLAPPPPPTPSPTPTTTTTTDAPSICDKYDNAVDCSQETDKCDWDCLTKKCRQKGSFTPPKNCSRHCHNICTCRSDPKCGYDVDTDECVPDSHLCAKFEDSFGDKECKKRGHYARGGVLCKVKDNEALENCLVDETILAINLGNSPKQRHTTTDFWEIHFWGENEWPWYDPFMTKRYQTSKQLRGVEDKDIHPDQGHRHPVWAHQIWGAWELRQKDRCIKYMIPVCRAGNYVLMMKTVDNEWEGDQIGKRGYNIYFNGVRIVAELDIIKYTGMRYLLLHMYLNFKIDTSSGGNLRLIMNSYKETDIMDNEIPLEFCYGECYHYDQDYHIGGFAVVRLVDERDLLGNSLQDSGLYAEDNTCARYRGGDKANKCSCFHEKECSYVAETGDCRPMIQCTACMLANRAGCRRKGVFYSLGGYLCKNNVDAGNCKVAEVLFAINFGGPEYTDERGITYQADKDVTDFEDPHHTKKTGKVSCDHVENDKDLYCKFMYGKTNSHSSHQCISYEVEISVRGWHEINFKFAEFYREPKTPGAFNIKIDDRFAIQEMDILKYTKKRGKPFDVTILFDATSDGGWIWMKKYGGINNKDRGNKLKISFCYSDCAGSDDGIYTVSAMSVVRLDA